MAKRSSKRPHNEGVKDSTQVESPVVDQPSSCKRRKVSPPPSTPAAPAIVPTPPLNGTQIVPKKKQPKTDGEIASTEESKGKKRKVGDESPADSANSTIAAPTAFEDSELTTEQTTPLNDSDEEVEELSEEAKERRRREKGKGRAEPEPTKKESELMRLRKELALAKEIIQGGRDLFAQVRNALSCMVCLEILDRPFALSCGHIFCRKDLWNWFHRKGPTEAEDTIDGANDLDEFDSDDEGSLGSGGTGESGGSHHHHEGTAERDPPISAARRRRNLLCPQCRAPVRDPPIPIYGVQEAAEALRTSDNIMNVFDNVPDAHSDEVQGEEPKISGPTYNDDDVTWSGLFPHVGPSNKANAIPLGVRNRGIRDVEDGVRRCYVCNWEIEDNECTHCGEVYSDAGSWDEDYDSDESAERPRRSSSEIDAITSVLRRPWHPPRHVFVDEDDEDEEEDTYEYDSFVVPSSSVDSDGHPRIIALSSDADEQDSEDEDASPSGSTPPHMLRRRFNDSDEDRSSGNDESDEDEHDDDEDGERSDRSDASAEDGDSDLHSSPSESSVPVSQLLHHRPRNAGEKWLYSMLDKRVEALKNAPERLPADASGDRTGAQSAVSTISSNRINPNPPARPTRFIAATAHNHTESLASFSLPKSTLLATEVAEPKATSRSTAAASKAPVIRLTTISAESLSGPSRKNCDARSGGPVPSTSAVTLPDDALSLASTAKVQRKVTAVPSRAAIICRNEAESSTSSPRLTRGSQSAASLASVTAPLRSRTTRKKRIIELTSDA